MAEPAGQQSTTSLSWRVHVCRASWKVLLFVWGTLILGILINVGSSWLIARNFDLGGTPLRWGVDHLWVMLLLMLLLAMLTLFSWLGSHEKPSELLHPSSQQNRDHMLKRLRRYYEQILTQSLQGAVQVELGLAERPAAVQNALSLSLHLPNPPEQPLPPHLSIIQAYELAQRELLILGEPGAGKSTQLLELAMHLLERAEQDATKPFPVVLPLSSWATKQPPLLDWLAEQVTSLYNVSKRVSQQWLQKEWLLPLLDGLDEVEEAKRPACIAAINAYHHEHVQPLVVCSRTNEYEAASTHERLVLHMAVVVQPLSSGQVHAYLEEIGRPVAALRAALKKNTELAGLATTPLMLQVLILTYQGTKVRELSQKEAQLRQQIWADYVQRMVSRKGDANRYPLQVTTAWLSWLARQMQTDSQTIFFLEDLQPDWLPKGRQTIYRWSVGLAFGLVGWLLVWLGGGLVFGLVSVLLFWLMDKMFDWLEEHVPRLDTKTVIEPTEAPTWSWKEELWEELRPMMPSMLGIVLVFGLFSGLFGGLFSGFFGGLVFGLAIGLVVGLPTGVTGGVGAALQHYTLRFWLWGTHTFPFKAVPFLEDASARILLRRVGGGYSFTHRLLLDYFADLDVHPSLLPTADPSTPSPTP